MADNPGAAYGYIYRNVGVEEDVNDGTAYEYAYRNVGVEADQNPGQGFGYVYRNLVRGAGYTIYPYAESEDVLAGSRY